MIWLVVDCRRCIRQVNDKPQTSLRLFKKFMTNLKQIRCWRQIYNMLTYQDVVDLFTTLQVIPSDSRCRKRVYDVDLSMTSVRCRILLRKIRDFQQVYEKWNQTSFTQYDNAEKPQASSTRSHLDSCVIKTNEFWISDKNLVTMTRKEAIQIQIDNVNI